MPRQQQQDEYYEEQPRQAQRSSQPMQSYQQKSNSGSGMGMLAIFVALLFIAGPIILQAVSIQIPAGSMFMLMGFGVILLLIGMIVITITRLYHRAPADRAFVRTGLGGPRSILDGGALVIPVVHEVVWVSLRTMRFEVTRSGEFALITKNYLRADITAEFFIKVEKTKEGVQNAATSLGSAAIDPRGVEQVLDKKLESALRQVAAEMELTQLLVNRAEFIDAVKNHVGNDIKNNGLVLESVTISRLDQTPAGALKPEENIFDAQAARNIAEVTTAQNVQRNKLTLDGKRQIEQETVATDQFLFQQKVTRETAAANTEREIRIAQALANQEAATQAAEQDRLAKVAGVERDKAIQLAEVTQAQAVEVAGQTRERAVREAEIGKDKAVQVASRDRDITVADKERELAQARAAQLAAEAEKTAKAQQVTTVEVTATAEREKARAVISAEAQAGQQRVQEQTKADIAAYTVVKQAEAQQDAAQRQADATLIKAKAEQQAKALQAQGDQAVAMVPVAVSREQVEVERAKVAVQRESLANQSEFDTIAKELQVELVQIAANRDVQIESAKAIGVAFSQAKITIWGDPTSVARMTESFYRGQQLGKLVSGISEATPDGVKGMLEKLATAVSEKFGLPVSPEILESLMEEHDDEKVKV